MKIEIIPKKIVTFIKYGKCSSLQSMLFREMFVFGRNKENPSLVHFKNEDFEPLSLSNLKITDIS